MGKITGFMEIKRETPSRRPVKERLQDWREYDLKMPEDKLRAQGARCMDCGIPFCHKGCPLGNIIPDWNDLIYRGRWKDAIDRLHSTNNFPEFTGRVCPAPCEEACVLNINNDPVTIKLIEKNIIDHAWAEGWVQPQPAPRSSGKRVAVVGSGPAGLACAQQLARAGHAVTLYERSDRVGGLLMYGIPDFKMEKHLVHRRVEQMKAEGVEFVTSCRVGTDITADELRGKFDAIALTMGATKPRDLPIPGRELKGIHFAMEFLPQQNKRNQGDIIPEDIFITAKNKRVVILGGGDTGSDCLGTSIARARSSVHQYELLPMPPDSRTVGDAVARLADDPAHLHLARRGGESRLEHQHQKVFRRAWPRHQAARHPAGVGTRLRWPDGDEGNRGQRLRARMRPGAAGAGIPRPGAGRNHLAARAQARSSQQRAMR